MAVERARKAQRRRAEAERLHLEQDDVLAGDLCDLLIVADGTQHPPERGVRQPVDQEEQHDDGRDHDAQEEQVEQVRAERAAEGAGDAREAVGAVGDPQLVRHDDAQRLGKAQRDDGQVVAAQPHGDESHQHAEQRRGKHAGGHADDDGEPQLQGQQPGHVGPHGEEADEAQIDQPSHPPDDVHAERHQRVDPGRDSDGDEVVLHARPPQYALAPRMPRGRSVSTSRMARKPMALR